MRINGLRGTSFTFGTLYYWIRRTSVPYFLYAWAWPIHWSLLFLIVRILFGIYYYTVDTILFRFAIFFRLSILPYHLYKAQHFQFIGVNWGLTPPPTNENLYSPPGSYIFFKFFNKFHVFIRENYEMYYVIPKQDIR